MNSVCLYVSVHGALVRFSRFSAFESHLGIVNYGMKLLPHLWRYGQQHVDMCYSSFLT